VVIPHFAALGDHGARHLLDRCRAQGWTVVLPNRPPVEVASVISGADLVVTSSLHGLVFADQAWGSTLNNYNELYKRKVA
ncbi:MAG: polysaccharide pyruvyl transferase family protein, partial [Burkholderiaceae bacterium]|nr:polysaccharide pyruvyl transferase family protein [Burkholderiaceae bacterium]